MTAETIVITSVASIASSTITAYITTRLKLREEREKWDQEYSAKIAELRLRDPEAGANLAAQFPVGFLVFRRPHGKRTRAFIPKHGAFTIGTKAGNTLVLAGKFVSEDHALIAHEASSLVLIDLGTNQVYLNGKRVSRAKLESGNIIGIASTKLRFFGL